MSSSYSSLDWVLSHWVHFTVHSLDLVVFICVYFVFFHTAVLLSAQWGGPNGIEAWSLGLLFFQCFDTVGWVFWPIKAVPDMTYNEFGGTLNLAQLNSVHTAVNINFGVIRPKNYHIFVRCRGIIADVNAAIGITLQSSNSLCNANQWMKVAVCRVLPIRPRVNWLP